MGEFTIEAPALRQALTTATEFAHIASKSYENLPAINAVHIEPATGDTVEMVATDRYVLSAETLEVTGEPFAFTMPYEAAKNLVKLIPRPRKNSGLNGTVTFTQDGVMVVARHVGVSGEASTKFTPVEENGHTFPNYRFLFSGVEKADLEPVGQVMFSSVILGRVFKVLADRVDDHIPVKIQFRGGAPKPVLVTQDEGFKVLVMQQLYVN